MTLDELVCEFLAARKPGWVVLSDPEVMTFALEALRFCAAHISIASITRHDGQLPGVSEPGAPLPVQPSSEVQLVAPLPIKEMDLLDEEVELTAGEWSTIRPLFGLYVERENAQRLEASRSLGVEVFGRQVSEVTQDILAMEREIPMAGFCHAIIEI